MTLSIWIIITIIIAVFFLFYYKKNKFKLSKPINQTIKKERKYKLFDSEKMLENVTTKEIEEDVVVKEKEQIIEKKESISEDNISSPKKKSPISFKEGIISSILLEKKD